MKVDGRFRYTSSEILPALFLILAQQETCLSIRIITPNYWCCIILWAFCSSSPRVLLVSLKKFYCHCAVGRTIGKIRGPRHSPRCQRRQDLARRLQEQSQSSTWFTAPPNLVQTLCQLLRWCQLWWLHCWAGLGPGCSSWGYCPVTSVGSRGGVIQSSIARWEVAA